jgi:multidrug efflux pump subunit AcrA (membrane-fusion protein)
MPTNPPARRPEEWPMSVLTRLRHPGRAAVVNGVLALAVTLVGLVTYRAVALGSTPDTSTARTTTVDTGTVTSTVSSSGNIEADRTLAVDFEGSGGTVEAIYVKPGDVVHRGQALARVVDTSARQALESAQVQLESADASYAAAVQGQTPQERAADQQSIAGSQVSLRSAELSLRQARQSAALDLRQKKAAVVQAQHQLRQAQQATPVDRAAVQSAHSALTAARQARASSILADRHQGQRGRRRTAGYLLGRGAGTGPGRQCPDRRPAGPQHVGAGDPAST